MFAKSLKIAVAIVGCLSALPALSQNCNPTSTNTCLAPFPSNFWADADTNSPTGVSLNLSNDVLPTAVLDQLPQQDGYTAEQIFNGSSGFSAASSVIFEFADTLDADSLPANGGNAVIAWDVTRQQAVDIRALVSEYARSDKVKSATQNIEIFPEGRWAFGHTILVVVTNELGIPQTSTIDQRCSASNQEAKAAAYCNELLTAINQAGLSASNINNATLFTVRDRQELLTPMRNTLDTVWNNDHPVRKIKVFHNFYTSSAVGAWIEGEIRIDNYRINNGTGPVDFNKAPSEQWVPFNLAVPRSAQDKPAPVAMYFHGITASKNEDSSVKDDNAELGMATFSISFPNHGDRAKADGGTVLSNIKTEKIGTFAGMIQQNTFDFASAHRALMDHLSDIDVISKPSWYRWCWACADGKADLDTSQIMIQGTSLGGVLGLTYTSLGENIHGGIFRVTGAGVTSILSESALWDLYFNKIMPSEANGTEALVLRAMIQHDLDFGDSINYADLLRQPDQPRAARPILVTTGEDDTIVTNPSSVSLAKVLDLAVIGNQHFDMPNVRNANDYEDDGFGLRQHKSPAVLPEPIGSIFSLNGNIVHNYSYKTPEAKADQKEWIERFYLAD